MPDAQLGKVHSAVERMKQVFREKVMLELNKYELENKRLEEQIGKEDNTRKKIREMTIRESILKEELMATRAEMESLNQQNKVLERDIHTCNFERINLTRQLQSSNEKFDKLKSDINRQMKEKSSKPRQSLFPVISKDGFNTTSAVFKQAAANHFARTASQQHLQDARHGAFNRAIDEADDNFSQVDGHGRTAVVGQSSSSRPKKKGFSFVNGRLERRFNVKK